MIEERYQAAIDFDRVSRYLGWGDPNGHGLWFIGIEEGSYSYESREDLTQRLAGAVADGQALVYPSPGYAEQFEGARRSQIPNWQARIASPLSRSNVQSEPPWKAYRDNRLWQSGSRVFSANLYPLPKKSISSRPDKYADLFGVGSGGFLDYYKRRCQLRHSLLRQYWLDKNPSATICFGKPEWPTFRSVLGLDTLAPKAEHDGVQCYMSDGRVVILTTFFGRGQMNAARAESIIKLLSDLNVSLP